MRALAAQEARIVRLLEWYLDATDPPHRTVLLKVAARELVDLRKHFRTDDDQPDWKGSTYPYKAAVSRAFTSAGLEIPDRRRFTAAVSYHVSTELRKRLDADQIKGLGLEPGDARQRLKARRNA